MKLWLAGAFRRTLAAALQEVGVDVAARTGECWDGVKIMVAGATWQHAPTFAIFQSDDLAAVQRYVGQWNAYMDIVLVPVLDDEESAAVARQIVADNNA